MFFKLDILLNLIYDSSMPKLVRLSDIAERVGVSTVTVSNALAGRKGISEALRARIRETARRMGYGRPGGEHGGRRPSGGNIGILVQNRYIKETTSLYWEFFRRILGFLQNESTFGILEIVPPEDEKNLVSPQLFREKKADGIIVLGMLEKEYRRFITSLAAEAGIPLVFLDSDEGELGNISVISNGYYGMYNMTKYLIEMGHRDILYVGSIDLTSSILDRYYGYCRAMRENGLKAAEPWPDRDENGVTRIALPEALPEAFACNCDFIAAHFITLLMERNLSIPGDISVVGFDDFIFPGYVKVPLTTWAMDMDGMARTSVDIITGKIPLNEAQTRILCGHIVIRESVRRRE
jgi:DNA-binding LacI/PurR family transcriptional regulator